MDKLRISYANGIYIISDHNDERLNIIGQILVDEKVRNYFYNQIKHLVEILQKEIFKITSSDKKVEFEFKVNENGNMIINVNESIEPHKLTTDINKNVLKDLIEQYEELLDLETDEIVLTRYQDTFKIEASEEH